MLLHSTLISIIINHISYINQRYRFTTQSKDINQTRRDCVVKALDSYQRFFFRTWRVFLIAPDRRHCGPDHDVILGDTGWLGNSEELRTAPQLKDVKREYIYIYTYIYIYIIIIIYTYIYNYIYNYMYIYIIIYIGNIKKNPSSFPLDSKMRAKMPLVALARTYYATVNWVSHRSEYSHGR